MAESPTIRCPICSRDDVKVIPAVLVHMQEFFHEQKLVLENHDCPDYGVEGEYLVRCPASTTSVTFHRQQKGYR